MNKARIGAVAALATMMACAEEPTKPRQHPVGAGAHQTVAVLSADSRDDSQAYIVLFDQNEPNVPALARQLIRDAGGVEKYIWQAAVRGFAVRGVSPARLSAIQQHPRVRLVEPDGRGRMRTSGQQVLPYVAPSYATSPLWALDRIDHAGTASYNGLFNYTNLGSGVHVYILDTGVRGGHVEFTGRIGNGACFVTFSIGCSQTIDADGHGTAVASVAAGTTYGVAKAATIHPVRIGDDGHNLWDSDIISGLDWVRANAQHPAVANLSINGYPSSFAIRDAIDQVVASNVLLFKSAGDDNVDAFSDRSNRSPGSVVVGATNANDFRVVNANFGGTVSLMAPGIAMQVAWSDSNTDVATVGGSSFSAPLAAGVAAAMLSANGALSASQLRSALLTGANQVTVGNGSGVANRVLYSQITPPSIITASISGPNIVRANQTCLYTAGASGAPGPYSYAWKVNGSAVGSNSPTLNYTNQGTAHTVAVTISSPVATSGNASLGVSISAGAPTCQW